MRKAFCVLAAMLVGAIAPANAQSDYPSKPVTIVVPFAAGGPSDGYTRALAESVARFDEVEGLVLLGSTAAVDRIDEWSDHDFYLVVREGSQERFRNELTFTLLVDVAHDAEQVARVNAGGEREGALLAFEDRDAGDDRVERVARDR